MKVYYQKEKLPLKKNFFGPIPPRFLEIGFGKGDFMVYLFALSPNSPLIGIEISEKMIDITHKRLGYPTNLFIFKGDAEFVMKYVLPENISLEKIFMLFPFPWPKEKHKKRRIFERDFHKIIYNSLKKNGKFYMVTDEEKFYEYSKEKLLGIQGFKEDIFEKDFKEKALLTKYARKWKNFNKNFYFLCVKKYTEEKIKIEKKIKILPKRDHFVLETLSFDEYYENKEREKVFILKDIYESNRKFIFEFISKEEVLYQEIFLILEKRKNYILRILSRESIIYTDWIEKNIKIYFKIG